MKKNLHVVPHDRKWGVRRENSEKLSAITETQEKAIIAGKEFAKRSHSELFIHGRDGKIRERNSYGRDPFPPKG